MFRKQLSTISTTNKHIVRNQNDEDKIYRDYLFKCKGLVDSDAELRDKIDAIIIFISVVSRINKMIDAQIN